jgi:hypothetical protein
VVLAELWTGKFAWQGTIGVQVKKGSRPFSPDELKTMGVPDPIIALIEKCWAQEPSARPTFAELASLGGTFDTAPQGAWPAFLLTAATGPRAN